MDRCGQTAEEEGKPAELLVAQNRAASYNYHLLERLEASMVLLALAPS